MKDSLPNVQPAAEYPTQVVSTQGMPAPAPTQVVPAQVAPTQVVPASTAPVTTAVPTSPPGSSSGPTDTAAAPPEDRRGIWWATPQRWRGVDWLICLGLIVVSMLLVAFHVAAYPKLSPIDELQHLDYTYKASQFEVPHIGDRVGDLAMSEAACRSVDSGGYVGPDCGQEPLEPEMFQELGINTSAGQFPIYYFITGMIARGIVEVGVVSSFVTAARLVGGLWLGFGWVLLWYAMALLGIRRWQRAATVSLFIATPLLVFHSATINADVPLFFSGALVLVATIKYASRDWGWWWLVPIYVLTYFTEPTNTLIVFFSAAFLLLESFRRGEGRARWVFPLLSMITVVLLRWRFGTMLHDYLFPRTGSMSSAPMFRDRKPVDITSDLLLDQVPSGVMPIGTVYLPPFMSDGLSRLVINLSNWLMIALVGATAFLGSRAARLTRMGRLAILACLLVGPTYTFYYAYFSNVVYQAPGRFALPLLASLIAIASAAIVTRFATFVAFAVGAAVIVNALLHMTLAVI